MAGENPGKKVRTGENTRISVMPLETDPSEDGTLFTGSSQNSTENNARDNALSNYLVLKNIISKLDTNDIESCCQVNTFWQSVAEPLVTRYYDIRLELTRSGLPEFVFEDMEDEDDGAYSTTVALRKRASYNSELLLESTYTFQDAIRLLSTALESEKIGINLRLWVDIDLLQSEDAVNFLTRFGPYVEKFSAGLNFTIRSFCQLVVRYFPKLRHLDLSKTLYAQDFSEDVFQKPMKFLKRIDICSDSNSEHIEDYRALVQIFRMSPNLEEIHDFPVVLADALVASEKVHCVKSLVYPNRVDAQFETAIEKLANLEMKLQSFSFNSSHVWGDELIINARTQPFVRRILEASHDSLVSLTLHKSRSFDFGAIPPMTSLQEITFMLMDHLEAFFPTHISLPEVFPNVSTVEIPTLLYGYTITGSDIVNCFPENQFLPWGLKIKTLKIVDVSLEILEKLSLIFPAVKALEFHVGETCNELKVILPAIGRYWPQIECLTVVVYCPPSTLINHLNRDEPCSFDSMFTGIPEDVIAQLKDPERRKQDFSLEKIDGFKEASTIRKLRKLKTLVFELDSPSEAKFKEKIVAISSISHEFGFRFLPDLKLLVRTHQDSQFQMISDIKASIPPIINLDIERVQFQKSAAFKWRRWYDDLYDDGRF